MLSDVTFDQGVEVPEFLSGGDLSVILKGQTGRMSLRIKPADRTVAAKALGITLPAKIGTTSVKNDIISACLGPDEWIIIAPVKAHDRIFKKAIKLSEKTVMSATDISFRNVGLVLAGPAAQETVNVGCPLDLRLAAFPVGKCTRTVFEASPILLYRAGETEFHMECWRSFAPYVLGLISAHVKGNVS